MNKFMERSKNTYNKIADNYDNTFEGKFTKKFKELLIENIIIKENSKVLDVACGNATLLKMINNKKSIIGYGIDISEEMIKNAKTNCENMEFSVAGCSDIPYDSDDFDVVTVCAAFHHFPDADSFFTEASRLLKKGGYLYIADIYLPEPIRILANLFVPLSKEGGVKIYSPKNIKKISERMDFKYCGKTIKGLVQINCMQKVL